jgi:hypothetical protein
MRASDDGQDVIDALASGHAVDGFDPTKTGSAPSAWARPFIGVAGDDEQFGPMRLRDLEPKQRDATRPLQRNAHPRPEATAPDGHGLAWLPCWLMRDDVASGRPVTVLGAVPAHAFDSHALRPRTPHLPLRVRLAVDAPASALPPKVAFEPGAIASPSDTAPSPCRDTLFCAGSASTPAESARASAL